MKIFLPKDVKSFVFTDLNLVELNNIEVDRLLPHIYELAIKGNRYGRANKDFFEKDYENRYLPTLLDRPELEGFAEIPEGRDIVDAWLRSSVVAFGRSGVSHRTAKMDYIRARTLAAYRAGFPDRRRSRQADRVIYIQMLNEVERRQQAGLLPSGGNAIQVIREWVRDSVGEGVTITDPPAWAPKYDGHTTIDISTLLSLFFLEGFTHDLETKKEKTPHDAHYRKYPAVPAAAAPLGRDVVSYLLNYRNSTPLQTAQHLTAILGIRLFQLPLRTSLAIHELLETSPDQIRAGALPSDMQALDVTNPLEQYVDFSGDPTSTSSELARSCVQRDLRLAQTGLRDRLLLLTVKRAAETSEELPSEYEDWTGPQRFTYLVEAVENANLEPYFKQDLLAIRRENSERSEDEETIAYMEALGNNNRPALERLTEVIYEATKTRAPRASLAWFRDTGGLNRAIGMLVGDSARRETWSYAPGNDLVTALLGIVFSTDRGVPRREMQLSEVLSTLVDRFGLLIDRPPTEFDMVATRAAASANLEAFKRRLKLLGVFDGLSDDFSAQTVLNPLLLGETK